ncbi:MAG: PKD domain-containing protein [Chitinophagaceae bacterium]|nr:PKD domain-containing protein [Chitinophagaceae bacterium]
MKKFFLLMITFFALQKANAQIPCGFTFVTNGPSVIVTPNNVAMPLIYTLDSVRYDFGDGNSVLQIPPGITSNILHTYAANGVYYVCFTRYISQIGVNVAIPCTSCDTVVIGALSNCMASLSSTVVGNTATFNTIVTGGTPPYTYNYNYGDGNFGVSNIHTYALNGVYFPCVTVTDANNMTCVSCDSFSVGSVFPNPCSATFTKVQTSGSNFNFTSTATGPGTITNYIWDFGDGNNSTLQNPSHNYTTTGNYNVCLTVIGIDSNNLTYTCTWCDSLFAQGSGGNPCIATANFTNSVSGLTVNLTNTSTCVGCVTSTNFWTLGDGNNSFVPSPSHTYAAAGTYNVCLTVLGVDSSNAVCVDSNFCQTITVGTSGVKNIEQNNKLAIYPNPTNSYLEIDVQQMNHPFEISICDVSGKKVKAITYSTINQKTIKVDVAELNAGLYFISLQDDKNNYKATFSKKD